MCISFLLGILAQEVWDIATSLSATFKSKSIGSNVDGLDTNYRSLPPWILDIRVTPCVHLV